MNIEQDKATEQILRIISQERQRQETLREQGKFPFTCASYGYSNFAKLPILIEKVGEVAGEVTGSWKEKGLQTEKKIKDAHARKARLKKKLIQVAALATAWAESL